MLSSIELKVLLHRAFTFPDATDQHGDTVVCYNMCDFLELRAEIERLRRVAANYARDIDLQKKIDDMQTQIDDLTDKLRNKPNSTSFIPLYLF